MKSVISLALIVGLVGTTVPAAAQRGPAPGPLARSVALEATRLAVEPAPAAAVPQISSASTSNWSRVRSLKPGTEVILTIRGAAPATRYVALTDQAGVDLLNVVGLPDESARALLAVAREYALFVADARRGGVRAGSVRIGPAGVLIDGQKVAELGEVLERVERTDILEVRTEAGSTGVSWARRHPAGRGALIGIAAGVAASVVVVAVKGDHWCVSDEPQSPPLGARGNEWPVYEQAVREWMGCRSPAWLVFTGGIGSVLGAAVGTAKSAGSPLGIVYRAP